MNRKIVYETVDVSIALGASSFAAQKQLKHGTCLGVRFIDFSKAPRANAINIDIEDSDGIAILGKTDFRDFEHGGGGHLEGYKRCNFDSKAIVNIQVTSTAAIAGTAFDGQLIFAVDITDRQS